MLVLARLQDEKIMIGDDVAITVVEVRGHKVRLGIDAPKDISVHRREVYEAILRNAGIAISGHEVGCAKLSSKHVEMAELIAVVNEVLTINRRTSGLPHALTDRLEAALKEVVQ